MEKTRNAFDIISRELTLIFKPPSILQKSGLKRGVVIGEGFIYLENMKEMIYREKVVL